MSLKTEGRLATLMARKAQLEAALHQEARSLHPDHLRMTEIKRQKLQLKQEIVGLSEAS